MPALMMTNVCPSPNRRIGVIATRMFCELRTVRKLTAPLLTIGTATTKKRIIKPRKAHAQTRLSMSTNCCDGVVARGRATPTFIAALDSRSTTRSLPRELERGRRGYGETRGSAENSTPPTVLRRSAPLLARDLIDE